VPCYLVPQDVVVRHAREKDLPGLFELDRIVTYEYFKPLYISSYAHLPVGHNPNYYLDMEIEEDKEWFPACIAKEVKDVLLVAHDTINDKIVGLIGEHQDSRDELKIDLLLILKAYRGRGIDKRLVCNFLQSFPDAKSCVVYPFQYSNEATLSFY